MALLGVNKSEKRKTSDRTLMLKFAVEKLQRSFTLPKRPSRSFRDSDQMMVRTASRYGLPEDVKKGHFSVLAVHDGIAKKYVVPLCFLNDPSFLRLLEKAAEEFGFEHDGALCIPCRWNELDSILGLDGRY